MELAITQQEREHMKAYIKAHPIDHAYDAECECFDGNVPAEQLISRDYQEILDANPE